MNSIKKYYSSQEDFNRFYNKIKLIQCPFCHLISTLILHGYLYGYSETYDSKKYFNKFIIIQEARLNPMNHNARYDLLKTTNYEVNY